MKIQLLAIGKTDNPNLVKLVDLYIQRLERYCSFELLIIPDIKKGGKLPESRQKEEEGKAILQKLLPTDVLILLDEKGTELSSVGFSKFLQKQMNSGPKRLVFLIGGPYGFSPEIYERAQGQIALSKLTFSHQMVRLFFVEQLYRAFTILRNEPYHHR